MDMYGAVRELLRQMERVVEVQADLTKTIRLQQEQIDALQDRTDGAGPTTDDVAREIGWEGPAEDHAEPPEPRNEDTPWT